MNKAGQLKALAKRMKPMHVKMGIALGEGMKQLDAYVAAGGKGKDPIKCASSMIKTNLDISIYAELSRDAIVEVAQERGLMTFEAKAAMLEDMALVLSKGCTDKDGNASIIDSGNATKALMAHNAMTGDLAAIKTDNKTAIDLSGLSDAQLQQIVANG